MYILIATVMFATPAQITLHLSSENRFPTEQQCESHIERAAAALQLVVGPKGGQVVDMRCTQDNKQDI